MIGLLLLILLVVIITGIDNGSPILTLIALVLWVGTAITYTVSFIPMGN